MTSRQKIRVALVGAGAAGQAHAFGYRNVSMAAGLDVVDIDLAVVVDPNVELARRTADRYGYADATADLQRVVNDPSIDAISVALPNSVHAEVLPAILRFGQARPDRKAHRPQRGGGRGSGGTRRTVARRHRRRLLLPAAARPRRSAQPDRRRRHRNRAELHRLVQRRLRRLARRALQLALRQGDRRRGRAHRHRHPRDRRSATRHRPCPPGDLVDAAHRDHPPSDSGIDRVRRRRHRRHRAADGPDRRRCRRSDPREPHRVRHPELAGPGDPRITRARAIRLDRCRESSTSTPTTEPPSRPGPRRVFTGPAHPYFSDVAAMPGGGVGTGYAEAFVAEVQHFIRCIVSGTPMDTSFPSAYRVMLVVDAAQQSAATGASIVVDDLALAHA